jgi:bifunctional enzyme CysN/CysC
MVDAGLLVLCAFVSPFRAERRMVRELVKTDEFIEVFVDTPLDMCIARDPKGLYEKARTGRAMHVTGIDAPYEPPEQPEPILHTTAGNAQDLEEQVVALLMERKLLATS